MDNTEVVITYLELVKTPIYLNNPTLSFRYLLKIKGVPMLGIIDPRPHPDYKYEVYQDLKTKSYHIKWRQVI